MAKSLCSFFRVMGEPKSVNRNPALLFLKIIFQTKDVYGFPISNIDKKWWYYKLDALSGMEFYIFNLYAAYNMIEFPFGFQGIDTIMVFLYLTNEVCWNFIKSGNVWCMKNALHTHSSKHNWNAFSIQELIKAKDMSVENKPDWKKLIIFYLYLK